MKRFKYKGDEVDLLEIRVKYLDFKNTGNVSTATIRTSDGSIRIVIADDVEEIGPTEIFPGTLDALGKIGI